MQTIWKEIPNYEGLYRINKTGEVLSLFKNGKSKKEKILKPDLSKVGYYHIRLYKNGLQKTFKIHRLIAMVFIPNPDNKPWINHKNSIRTDNRVENLEWCTPKENFEHAIKYGGLTVVGQKNFHSKLKNEDILEIRDKYKTELFTQVELAHMYNVTQAQISTIILRKQWKHI